MITKKTHYEVEVNCIKDGWLDFTVTEEQLRELQEKITEILDEGYNDSSTGFATIAESIKRNDRLDVNNFEMENNKKFCPDVGIYINDNYYKFIKFLRENGAYKKYIYNRFDPKINTLYRDIIENKYGYINEAFDWADSLNKREGYRFWQDLNHKWYNQLD